MNILLLTFLPLTLAALTSAIQFDIYLGRILSRYGSWVTTVPGDTCSSVSEYRRNGFFLYGLYRLGPVPGTCKVYTSGNEPVDGRCADRREASGLYAMSANGVFRIPAWAKSIQVDCEIPEGSV
jgi:hypothetical protein